MALITFYKDIADLEPIIVNYNGSVISWLVENIEHGQNFSVYEGDISQENEISRDEGKILNAEDVTVFLLPAGNFAVLAIISIVVSVAAAYLLTPKVPDNDSGQQGSPNNTLSDRSNKSRPNRRIPEIVGQVLSVPDVIQREYGIYTGNIESRYGYYCVGTNQLQIESLKDGDSFISDLEGSSAGVYYPNKSPNNATPDVQIGDPINRDIVGVYSATEAVGQNIPAPNENTIKLNDSFLVHPSGYIELAQGGFDEIFSVGDQVDIIELYVPLFIGGIPLFKPIGRNTNTVIAVTSSRITFDITNDSSWSTVFPGGQKVADFEDPRIESLEPQVLGPFKNTTIKCNRIAANIYAPNGMFRQGSDGNTVISVSYSVIIKKLDDNGDPVGNDIVVNGSVSGRSSNERGATTEIDLGAKTFYQVSIKRLTNRRFSPTILEDIKLKEIYGFFDLDADNFGNVTTIQTKRTATAQTTSVRSPEINCIATELVYKYEGSGVFSNDLTPNTQAMQSIIRLALDPYIGRRQQSEVDLDLLLATQNDIENYFGSLEAGQCSYTFDDTNISAQESFFLVANAVFTLLWREGRVLKSYFEKPQAAPTMVFTHRSKKPGSETWARSFVDAKRKDSIEFKYTDPQTYKRETLYFPANRTGANPLKLDIPGIKGVTQATWRMMREYNKLIYRDVSVDFSTTSEGRFVRPLNLISVVKGTRINTCDGYIVEASGLTLTLSQDVQFTDGDDHFIVLKRRNGQVESIPAIDLGIKNKVGIPFAPIEAPYTGNDELKTEFSFGNEARIEGQLMLPLEIDASDVDYIAIKAINYTDNYYTNDPDTPVLGSFNNDFNDDFG